MCPSDARADRRPRCANGEFELEDEWFNYRPWKSWRKRAQNPALLMEPEELHNYG